MPHVDEGLLHAWLDGGLQAMSDAGALPHGITPANVETHLRACADCRALLEQERAIRERAGLVLHDAALPVVDAPPFEMIAQHQTATRKRTWLPMAWAASVLLAVGAGWWGSEIARSDEATQVLESTAARASDAQRETAAVADAPTAQAAADEPAPMPQARAAAPSPSRAPPPIAVAPTTAGENTAGDAQKLAAPPTVAAERAEVAALQPVPLQQDTIVVATRAGAQQPSARVGPTMLQRSTDALTMQTADPLLVAFRENVRRARAGEFEWLPLREDDLRRSSTPLIEADGATLIDVHAAAGTVPGRLLRVRQRLASGEELELLVWRRPVQDEERATAVAPGAPPRIEQQPRRVEEADALRPPPVAMTVVEERTLPEGRRETVVFVPALHTYVAASGELDAESLRALVARLVLRSP
jgi:hypothetical protein